MKNGAVSYVTRNTAPFCYKVTILFSATTILSAVFQPIK